MTADEKIAICPGSFDPITLGHVDIVERALAIADRVIVAVAHTATQSKRGMFTIEERLAIIEETFAGHPGVEAAEFQGLLVDFARERGAGLLVRGLRGVADFEYEFQMARMNRSMSPGLETIFIAPDAALTYISATLVREITTLGGDPTPYVPPAALRRLREKGT